jgi:hypothetical protein
MDNKETLRALIVISSDGLFSQHHPLWKMVEGYRVHFSEIHLVVFVKGKVPADARVVHGNDHLFIYHVSQRFLLLNIAYVWSTLQFNLKWRGSFRPDLVISLTDNSAALLGYALSRRHKKKFFIQGSSHLLGQSKLSFRYLINRYLLQHSTAVFVPGPQTASLFSHWFSIPPAQLLSLEPPFDIRALVRSTEKFDYHALHPQYNFFISSVVYTMEDVKTLISVHEVIRAKYARVALFIIVEKALQSSVEHYIQRTKAFGVFAYELNDAVTTHIKGSHVYLALSREQDVDIMMVTALGLQVPVVARPYGIAPELFKGTQYEQHMVRDDTIAGIARTVIVLIEDQRLRTEYSLNTGLLLANVTFTTTEEYTSKATVIITEIVQPALLPVLPIKDLPPYVQEESAKSDIA